MKDWEKALQDPPKKYRPAPFWSWNERLEPQETAAQVREMDEAGMGGYFMHARGGLQTEYLSADWFANVRAALEEGGRRGMLSWGYDENGWPSGFGSGAVNGLGEKYQQKYLRCATTPAPVHTPHTIANIAVGGENRHFYYEVNPFYVDTLDGEVVEAFLRSTHAVYKEVLGKDFSKMRGFFTDEPQVSRNGFPWSLKLEEAYRCAYGEELAPRLPGLFEGTADCTVVRYRFWKLVRDLFAENYMKRIHDWCRENGSALTGHLVLEEGYYDHVLANGSCMASYEYMDIPGMDHLGRSLASIQTEMQVASVAQQLGQRQILAETFALCGWNVSFEELRRIYEHQMVHGINYLCQHLEGYSLRGLRKRDYPATLFKQQPWWGHYRLFNDMVSRIGMLLAEGTVETEILVLHTVESGWLHMEDRAAANACCEHMLETMQALETHQIAYHLGDGRILARHARVESGRLIVGSQRYRLVIVPPAECFGHRTYELLQQFKAQGGTLLFTEQQPTLIDGRPAAAEWQALAEGCPTAPHRQVHEAIPAGLRPITLTYPGDHEKDYVLATTRRFADRRMTMVYLCNPCAAAHTVTLTTAGGSASLFDAMTGKEMPAVFHAAEGQVAVTLPLPENGSAVVFVHDDPTAATCAQPAEKPALPIAAKLRGEWRLAAADDNALTLDVCDVAFDGQTAYRALPVSDVQEKACAFGRPVETAVTYHFTVRNKAFSRCELVLETPELFTVAVNGQPVEMTDRGYYFDRSFRRIDIYPYVQEGENTVCLTCTFDQSAATRESLEKSLHFESEKNKLSYDMEIEAVYLKGDFGVYTDAPFTALERRGLRTNGGFVLDARPETVSDGALAPQGFPFFAGSMTFRRRIHLTAEEAAAAQLGFAQLCSTVTQVQVNGRDAGTILWHPYTLDIAPLCRAGENEITITVTGNLRNLLGPFHLKEGESYAVCPHSFFHESPVWLHGVNPQWDDRYCFVEYGLFF